MGTAPLYNLEEENQSASGQTTHRYLYYSLENIVGTAPLYNREEEN